MNNPTLSMEDKIHRIEETTSLNEVSLECLPPVQTDKYYFVSYSHKDYKLVYKDIFNLQQRGFSIWYDRGMEAGKNWKETAEKYITKYNCSGVIFFMSENSILSDAIHEEIKLLIENGKEFLTINLPVDGKYMSAKEMLDVVEQRGQIIDPVKREFISKYLNEDIIYIRYEAGYEEKAEKINTLKSSPLFKIDAFDPFSMTDNVKEENYKYFWPYHPQLGLTFLETNSVNDIEIRDVLLKDFQNSLNEGCNILEFAKIGDSTFSNCRRLRYVELPETTSILGNYAFYNCDKLENIDTSNILMILDHAFEGCRSLKNIDLYALSRGKVISDFLLKNCTSLENVIMPKELNKIGMCAFENTKIKSLEVNMLYGDGICPYAFLNCREFESFEVKRSGDFEIKDYAFRGCVNFKTFIMEKGKIKVGPKAFQDCENLVSFPFNIVEEVGDASFQNCLGLTELELNGVRILGDAFKGCKNIKHIKINECLDYDIAMSAFSGLTALESLVLAPKLSYLMTYAFENCINLKTVYIPAGVEHIDESAFYNCKQLSEIYFAGTSEEWKDLMHQDFTVPWFEETGEYKVICSDKVLSKYEFLRK